ncbi:unnamed protein product [Scytosiphon promiscuus]
MMKRHEGADRWSTPAGRVVEKNAIKYSCDFCVKRKRSCDGFGLKRCRSLIPWRYGPAVDTTPSPPSPHFCSLCIAKDQPECHYSPRSRMAPRSSTGTTSQGRASNYDAYDGVPERAVSNGRSFFRRNGELLARRSQRLTAIGMRMGKGDGKILPLTLNRSRLSASPATGLVGLQENSFLGGFFDCMAFLPLASDSSIRETMVGLMSYSYATDQSSSGGINLIRPSTSSFWSAVAIGALLKGFPPATVEKYIRLAEDVLRFYAGPATAELALAWVILAFMHGCRGDHGKFYGYLTRGSGYVRDLLEKKSEELDLLPLGFDELIKIRETIVLFRRDVDGPQVIAEEPTLPQINGVATDGMVCKFVLQWYRRFEHRVYARDKMQQELGYQGASSDSILAERVAVASSFSRLGEYVGSSSLLSGTGGLAINGELMFDRVAKGDSCGALDRLRLCVEVCERFPGVCRSFSEHTVHQVLSVAAAMVTPRARELFERLRIAHNLVQEPGSLLVPPLDDWQGVSMLCDNRICRAVSNGFSSLRPVCGDIAEDEYTRPYGVGRQEKQRGGCLGRGKYEGTRWAHACGSSRTSQPHFRHSLRRASDRLVEATSSEGQVALAGAAASSSRAVGFGMQAPLDASGAIGGAALEERPGGVGISQLIYRAIEIAEEECDFTGDDWLSTSHVAQDIVGPRIEDG